HLNLDNIPWNTPNILASYQEISNGNILGNSLVDDVSGLAMFHHTNSGSVGHFISELMDAYL
ncbi:MAG: hypothetical protein RTU30_16155, partial [Candidatus Thorarchaeota archaeon]